MTVAAISAVLGGERVLKHKVDYPSELTRLTRDGLPVDALATIAQELKLDRKTLARLIGISGRTLSRRFANGERLSLEESDRVVRLARVVAKAIDTFGKTQKASTWLQSPNAVLDGHSRPMARAFPQ